MTESESARSTLEVTREVVERAREEEISFLAASVSFYAFISVFPLVIIALSLASILGGEAFEQRLLMSFEAYLSPEGRAVLAEAVTSPSGRFGASVFGGVTLLWSAFKVFQAVDIAFDRVYRAPRPSSILRRLVNAVLVLSAVVSGVTLLAAASYGASALRGTVPYAGFAVSTAAVLGLAMVFLPVYYVMPPHRMSFRRAVPGTVVAVAGWHVLSTLFGFYASAAARYQAYGFLGAVLLFLLWLYFSAVFLLVGAVVNSVLEDDS